MNYSFNEAIDVVDKAFARSRLLQVLGYATRQLIGISPLHFPDGSSSSPTHRFTVATSPCRSLYLDYSYRKTRENDSFTITVRNMATDDEFLLNEWMKEKSILVGAYPWGLSSYSGTFEERVAQFVTFLEGQLGSQELMDILAGRAWKHIPYDWGAMK